MPIDFLKIQPGKRTKVKILADCKVSGEHLATGRVIELSDEDAVQLISIAKAVRHEETIEARSADAGTEERVVKAIEKKGKRR